MSGLQFIALLVFAASPFAADLEYSNSYQADEMPDKAAPKWVSKGNAAMVEVKAGSLNVQSEGANKRQFYVMEPASGAWSMESGLATVEFRLKCSSTDPQDEVFRVQLSDGAHIWRVVFFDMRCNGVTAMTSDWDTYRLAVKDGKMQISSQKLGVIAEAVEGSPTDEEPSLIFGTFKNSQVSASRNWDLDFIRWTNDEARVVDALPTAP